MPTDITAPTAAEIRSFRALAGDVAYLRRGCGLLVAPFKGGFRINREVVDEVGLVARAAAERVKRTSGRAATVLPPKPRPIAEVASPFAPPAAAPAPRAASAPTPPHSKAAPAIAPMCKCGQPTTHQGPCWARRGMDGPPPPSGRVNPTSTKARLAALERDVAAIRDQLARRA